MGQRNILRVNPSRLLGMDSLMDGLQSIVWSAVPAAFFTPVWIHSLTATYQASFQWADSCHCHGLRAVCSRHLRDSLSFQVGEKLVDHGKPHSGFVNAASFDRDRG